VNVAAIKLLKDLTQALNPALALRGLWTLDQCGKLDAAVLTTACTHPSDIVRAWAVQLATETPDKPLLGIQELQQRAQDQSSTVRLAVASALPALPAAQRWDLVSILAAHKEDDTDRFLPKVLWTGFATAVKSNWSRAVNIAAATPVHELADSIRWFAAQDAAGRETLAAAAAKLPPADAGRVVRIAAFALRDESTLKPPANLGAVKKALGDVPEPAVTAAANELSAVFGDTEVLKRMRSLLADPNAPMSERRSAFNLLKRTGDKEALPVFATLLDNNAFRTAVIPLLGRSDDPNVATALLERYSKLSTADRSAALAALTSRAPLALTLVKAMAAGTFDKKQLTAVHIRQMRNLGSADLNSLLEKTWGKFNPSSEGSKASAAKFKKLYSEAPLWAYDSAKGKEVFNKVCAVCHAYGGGDSKVGPDMGGTWRNGIDYFLENITDPNAVIGDDFQLTIITKNDTNVVAGMVEKESDTSVVLRTLTESVSIPKADIKSREKLPQSLMPPGLLDAMTEREAIELLKFLTTQP
jgi:putative heme-binding domain-containing protein